MKLGQVGVGLNIAQNHFSSPYEGLYGHYLTQFTCKVDQKLNKVRLTSVRILLSITDLVPRKSYLSLLVLIHMTNGPKVKLDQVGVGSNIAQNHFYSTNHVYLHRPNAFGFWQTRLHLCYETLKRVSNFFELA